MKNQILYDLITPDNILSYSSACVQVHKQLKYLMEHDFHRLIIPSRGAYPFYSGAKTSISQLPNPLLELTQFSLHYNVWLLPYTSDWGDAKIETTSKQMRTFWTKILADTIRKESSPYTAFYESIVKVVGNTLTLNPTELNHDKHYKQDSASNEKFVFLDTAVSGRAICEIITAFSDVGLEDYFVILIVDEDGQKLERTYKNIIAKEIAKGKMCQINVQKLFSEDASPMMNSGISSIVFPTLLEEAHDKVTEFKNSNLTGAGLWFIDSLSHLRKFNGSLNAVRGTLQTLIYRGILICNGKDDEWFEASVQHDVESMIKWAGDFNLFDPPSTKNLIYDRISYKNPKFHDTINVSQSHVIRVGLNKKDIDIIIKPITRL